MFGPCFSGTFDNLEMMTELFSFKVVDEFDACSNGEVLCEYSDAYETWRIRNGINFVFQFLANSCLLLLHTSTSFIMLKARKSNVAKGQTCQMKMESGGAAELGTTDQK